MSVDPPTPIAIYIAENRGDVEALAECFAEDAVVRDEGKTIEGLAAIKQWKAETRKKYQNDGKIIVANRVTDTRESIKYETIKPTIDAARSLESSCGSSKEN